MNETACNGTGATQPRNAALRTCLLLAAITLIALGLRTWRLGGESAWWDEIASLQYLNAPTLADFLARERSTDPPMTPVYFVLEYGWSHIAGTSVASMRLLSVFLGLLTIQALYLLARKLYGSGAGLFAALLLALSLLHVYYSQEIRVYSLVLLLSLLSMYAFTAFLERGRLAWCAANALANALLVFTHLFAVQLLAVQACFLVLRHARKTRLLLPWFAGAAVIGAALALLVSHINTAALGSAASWMVKPGLRDIAMFGLVFAGGRASNENPAAHLPTGVSLDIVLAAILLLLITGFAIRSWTSFPRKRESSGPHLALLLLWLVLPPAILLVASYIWRPCFVYRYVLFSALPVYLLAGAALAGIDRAWLRRVLLAAIVALYAHQLSALAIGPFRPDWQSVSRYLESNTAPRDEVLVFQDINQIALEFNARLPREQMQAIPVWSELCGPVLRAHGEGRAVWFVVWLWSDPANLEACFAANKLNFDYKDFAGWPNLRVYRVAPDRAGAA